MSAGCASRTHRDAASTDSRADRGAAYTRSTNSGAAYSRPADTRSADAATYSDSNASGHTNARTAGTHA